MSDLKKIKPYDEVDYLIIKELKKDVRVPSSKIARETGLNERTIRRRIDRLLSTGAVRPTIVVEPSAFGYTTIVDIYLSVNEDKCDEVVELCIESSCVSYISAGWGEYNLLLQARFQNSEEMFKFIKERLESIEGVTVKSYTMVPKIYYNIDNWLPLDSDFDMSKK